MIFAVHLFYYSALREEGREEGGKVSSVPVSRSSWQGKTWRKANLESKRKRKKEKKTERAAIVTTTLLLFNFVSCLSFVPPLIW